MNIYGTPAPTPDEIKQMAKDKEFGIVRHHETTYLEYVIPSSLEQELSSMIDKRLDEFYKTCSCEDCKNLRILVIT